MTYTRPATAEDAVDIAARIRPAEVAEVFAATGVAPVHGIVASVRNATEAWATYLGGELACLWGVGTDRGTPLLGSRTGSVWLLTSAAVERHPKTFWRMCRAEVPRLLDRWDTLWNHIDARHAQAVRWAKRLGFPLEEPRPYGALGLPFCRFVLTREALCAFKRS